MILGPLGSDPTPVAIGGTVTVWFGDAPPAKLSGVVVAVIVPDEALRVRVTSRGDLPDAYDWVVGEEFDMWRMKRFSDAKYDTYYWSPTGEALED
jgi:hypothetical protein